MSSGPTEPPRPSPVRRRVLAGAVAAAAAVAGGTLAWWRQPKLAPLDSGGEADLTDLWALRVERPEGGELVLAEWRGQPLLINFWATWCPPCIREMPEIDRFHQVFGPQGWKVLGLAIDSAAPVREFLGRRPVGFAIGIAGLDGTELVRLLGNPQGGLPFTVMLGAQGRVLQRKIGETNFDELAAWASRT